MIPLKFYAGYSTSQRPQNVFGIDLNDKLAAFDAYTQFDKAVCQAPKGLCQPASIYEEYLRREYQESY
jgi:hypothetical protein